MGNNQSTEEKQPTPQPPPRNSRQSSSSSSSSFSPSPSSSLSSTNSRRSRGTSIFDRERSNSTKGVAAAAGGVAKNVTEEDRDPDEPLERLLRRLLYDTTCQEEDQLVSLQIARQPQQQKRQTIQPKKKDDGQELLELSVEEKSSLFCPPDGVFVAFPLSKPNYSYTRPGEKEEEVSDQSNLAKEKERERIDSEKAKIEREEKERKERIEKEKKKREQEIERKRQQEKDKEKEKEKEKRSR